MIPDCGVCGIPHDAAVHAAVLSVRRWLHDRLDRKLTGQEMEEVTPRETPKKPSAPVTADGLRYVPARTFVKQKLGRPRSANFQPRRGDGRGQAWNRNASLDDEKIIALRRQGKSYGVIAAELGAKAPTVHNRVARYEQRTGERVLTPAAKVEILKPPRRTPGRPEITAEMVVDLWKAGKSTGAILTELQCEHKLIERRIRQAPPGLATEVAALRRCGCGADKQAWKPLCAGCRERQVRR